MRFRCRCYLNKSAVEAQRSMRRSMKVVYLADKTVQTSGFWELMLLTGRLAWIQMDMNIASRSLTVFRKCCCVSRPNASVCAAQTRMHISPPKCTPPTLLIKESICSSLLRRGRKSAELLARLISIYI